MVADLRDEQDPSKGPTPPGTESKTDRPASESPQDNTDRQASPAGFAPDEVALVERIVQGKGFICFFQPVWSISEGRAVGFEALSRFATAPGMAPSRIFKTARAMGLGVELELAVIRQALRALPKLPGDCYLSVNVSPPTMVSDGLHEILDACDQPERLMLELTEHERVRDYERIREVLAPYRKHGLCFATDDAGAGHANLKHVLELKPDVVKLDRFLIQHIDTDPRRRAMVGAFLHYTEDTSTRLIAEGVEEQAELKVLRELGVDWVQGFLISPAVSLRQALSLGTTPRTRS